MSVEELNSIKEEIYQKMREFEKKMNEKLNGQTTEINLNNEKLNEKIDNILKNNREIIESVISEKIHYDKIHFLENFQKKADGMLISHEIRINNNNKDIGNMKAKYDRQIIDNLSVPGLIGPNCQYKSIGEYILYNRDEFSRIKYEKENLKQDSKEIRTKLDNQFKQIISLVDNSIERCKEYANDKIVQYNEHFDAKFDEFGKTALEIRLELKDSKQNIEEKVNHLKSETEKVLLMNKKFIEFEEEIKDINIKIEKINNSINKYDKKDRTKDFEKMQKEFKTMIKDLEKTKKMITENWSRNKDREKEKDIDKEKDIKTKKRKRFGSTIDFESLDKLNNSIKKKEKGRTSLFLPDDDKMKLSDLPDNSPVKAIYALRNSLQKKEAYSPMRRIQKGEGMIDKRIKLLKVKKSESNKTIKTIDNKEISKNMSIKKEERKNDFESSNNNDSSINKKTIESIKKENNEENKRKYNIRNSQNSINDIEKNDYQIENKDNLNTVMEKSEKMEITDYSNTNRTNDIKNQNKEKETKTIDNLENLPNEQKLTENANIKPFVIKEDKNNNIRLSNEIDYNNTNRNDDNTNRDYNNTNRDDNNSNRDDILNKNEKLENNNFNKSNIEENIFPKINIQSNIINLKPGNENLKNSNFISNSFLNKKNNINNEKKIINKNNNILKNNNYYNNKKELNNNINLNEINKNNENIDKETISSLNESSKNKNNNFNTSNSKSKNNSISNIASSSASNVYNSNRSSKRNSFNKSNNAKNKILLTRDNKNLFNSNKLILNPNSRNSKKVKKKFQMTQWNNNSNDFFNYPEINQDGVQPAISPHLPRLGVNYVRLNVENNQEDEDYNDIRISYSGKKLQNLRLEGIGASSPSSQKIERKKIRLQGISNEPPLKISAAFGRTAYTFIDKNNDKSKIYSLKNSKQKKAFEKNNLDLFFAPNNK